MWGVRHSFWLCGAIWLALATSVATTAGGRLSAAELTVDELKAKLTSASSGDKAHLCIQIAQLQLTEADKMYAAASSEQAQPALTDVVSFSEQARDYSIQSHKNQKQIEIAVRGMARKLTDLMHSLPHDEQAPLQEAIKRLQRVRDDLLVAMFPKGAK
jgi:hypothetical protein